MNLFAIPPFALVTPGSHPDPPPRRARRRITATLTRTAAALRRFYSDNIALWEAYERAQRPWENFTDQR